MVFMIAACAPQVPKLCSLRSCAPIGESKEPHIGGSDVAEHRYIRGGCAHEQLTALTHTVIEQSNCQEDLVV